MRRECIRAEDEIWEHVRTGCGMSDEVSRHAATCKQCTLALKESERVLELVKCAVEVPSPPDCREAIAARITTARPRTRPAWAYGFASVMIAAVLIFAALSFRPDKERFTATARHQASNLQPSTPSVEPRMSDVEPGTAVISEGLRPSEPGHSRASGPGLFAKEQRGSTAGGGKIAHSQGAGVPLTSISTPVKPARRQAAKVPLASSTELIEPHDMLAMAPSERTELYYKSDSYAYDAPKAEAEMNADRTAGDSQPVALVLVSWNAASDDNYSYSYTDRDTETGEVTRCSVKRSGDSVEIYMESEPEGENLPVKGSVEYETNPSA